MYRDIIYELQDLQYLKWSKTRNSSGTAGSFLKSYDDSGKIKKYYKLSDYDIINGIVGHECVNEIIVGRLMDVFGIEHLQYRLIHASILINDNKIETYLCESDDFKERNEAKVALEDFYISEKNVNESPMDFCKRMGWEEYIYGMLVVDFLISNRDRHGANIEVLRDRKSKSLRLAPLFDQGLSFVCRCHSKEELKDFDVMKDQKVQAFIGGNSTFENIKLIPKRYLKTLPDISDLDINDITSGLEGIMEEDYINKIREMIQRRWKYLDDIRNQR
jgi:hypothetical protein